METLRTNTMLWVWEECLAFSKIQHDSNLSIVCSIPTLFGALLRRCHNSCLVIDTCILPSLHKTGIVVDFLWWFFWETTRSIYRGGRQTLFTKARCSAAAWDIPRSILVLLSSGSLYNDYSHMCLSYFTLSSDVMWICAWTHPRQMQ